MELKKLFSNMAILGLFVFSILAFVVLTQGENSVDTPITNNSAINMTYSDLSGNLSDSESRSKTASSNFGNVTPTQQYGELEVTSIISPTKVAKTIIINFWNIFVRLPQIVLGVSPIVAGLISSIILIFLIIGIWAVWKGVVS